MHKLLLPITLIGLPLLFCGLAVTVSAQQKRVEQPHQAGPPFTVRRQNGVWQLVTPTGQPFFSMGVCCVTPGDTWLDYNPKNPGYAAWKQYPDAVSWADATVSRLQSWGFTTIGGWSDYTTLRRSAKMDMFLTPVLHVGSSAGAPWWDMWDPKVIRTMEDVARPQILAVRDDPRLLGYYTDNEMGWWNAALFQMTLEHKPESGQRKRLIQMLRAHYRSDWQKLLSDFVPEGANSFDALDRRGKLYLRPGGEGMQQVKRFVSLLADRYYALTRQIIRKYDRRGLVLGDRYQSFYYPEVARASRRYVDIVSTNLNASWNDGSFARFYLDTLHALTDKPILVSEFYMSATENRSGNRNDSSGFPVVPTQQERAENFRRSQEALAKTPCVVGTDWFQYYDEPTFGRGDGENYDMGLVDIADRPYEALTAASAALDRNRLHATPAPPRPDATGGVPPAPQEPTAHWKPFAALQNWDRERGFVPPKSSCPLADMYLCWDENAVYVGMYAIDVVEAPYYKDRHVPNVDRMEWTLRVGAQPPIRMRLGSGYAPDIQGAKIALANLSGLEHDVRNISIATLPAALFGKEKLRAGDRITLSSSLLTQARAYQVEWAGTFTLAGP
jgi:hypothetical protein